MLTEAGKLKAAAVECRVIASVAGRDVYNAHKGLGEKDAVNERDEMKDKNVIKSAREEEEKLRGAMTWKSHSQQSKKCETWVGRRRDSQIITNPVHPPKTPQAGPDSLPGSGQTGHCFLVHASRIAPGRVVRR